MLIREVPLNKEWNEHLGDIESFRSYVEKVEMGF